MPSQRRIRVFVVLAALFLIVIFYANHSSKQSDREFYDKTVKGMNDRSATKKQTESESKLNLQTFESKEQMQDAAHKSRLEGIRAEHEMREEETKKNGDAKAAVSPKDGPNASPVPGAAKKWNMGDDDEKPAKKEKSEEELDIEAELNVILKQSPIIIFSKSYCPFSKKAKVIFSKYKITPAPFIVELDEHKLGLQLQSQLEKITGRRTVPNILVTGRSIGGGDDVEELHSKGELIEKIKSLGGKRIMEIELQKSS